MGDVYWIKAAFNLPWISTLSYQQDVIEGGMNPSEFSYTSITT
jgi:hypothetical protein